jgi:hypothetical protein
VAYDNNEKKLESIYSKRIRAGKRRTYFFDVRATRGNDYYLTITESRKRFNDNGYDRHKIFLYKEDFNKFIKALGEAVDYVKTDLMPDFDFDAYNHEDDGEGYHGGDSYAGGEDGISTDAQQPAVTAISEVSVQEEERLEAPVPVIESNTIIPSSASTEEVDKW